MILVEKISVNIKVVGLHVERNFLIPKDMGVHEAVDLIVKALREEYPGVSVGGASGRGLLQASSGKVLNQACNFKQLGITPGERMILI